MMEGMFDEITTEMYDKAIAKIEEWLKTNREERMPYPDFGEGPKVADLHTTAMGRMYFVFYLEEMAKYQNAIVWEVLARFKEQREEGRSG
ncbi:MAG: hypothetical protein ABIJ57_00485 [Pseudomonadota bacterium]